MKLMELLYGRKFDPARFSLKAGNDFLPLFFGTPAAYLDGPALTRARLHIFFEHFFLSAGTLGRGRTGNSTCAL